MSGEKHQQVAAIASGRKFYDEKKHKPALAEFTRAMRLCPCYRGMQRSRCSCKDFEKVAAADGSIFEEAMYNCACEVGKTFSKCHRSQHIQALDYRAATFEAMGELDRARRDAEWILELAPRKPEGYLRLAKISRIQANHEFAWKIYRAGVDICKDSSMASQRERLIKGERSLAIRFVKRDPMMHLPAEIIQSVLSSLPFNDLLMCLRVCKTWRRTLKAPGYRILWRTIITPDGGRRRTNPSVKAFGTLLSLSHGEARSLIIQDASYLRLDSLRMLAITRMAKKLENLEVRQYNNHSRHEKVEIPGQKDVFSSLKRIVLAGDHKIAFDKIPLPYDLLRCAGGGLVNIDLTGDPCSWIKTPQVFELPPLPNLKYFRWRLAKPSSIRTTLDEFAASTPHLEQIQLDGVQFVQIMSAQEIISRQDHMWPNLKAVIFRNVDPLVELTPVTWLLSLNHGRTLQHVTLECSKMTEEGRTFTTGEPAEPVLLCPRGIPTEVPVELHRGLDYQNLQCLQLYNYVSYPDRLAGALRQCVSQGRLQTLDIIFPLAPLRLSQGMLCKLHLTEYGWISGCESIRHVAIQNFGFDSYDISEEVGLLSEFMASFPNLETLEVRANQDIRDTCILIETMAKRTRVRKIYQEAVTGVNLDELTRLLAAENVELAWGRRPKLWPLPLN